MGRRNLPMPAKLKVFAFVIILAIASFVSLLVYGLLSCWLSAQWLLLLVATAVAILAVLGCLADIYRFTGYTLGDFLASEQRPGPPPDAQDEKRAEPAYILANIRDLLLNGFDDRELRQLCFDVPDFRPVYHELARNMGKAEIVRRLLEHAEKRMQISILLALAEQRNPDRYEHHGPYYLEGPIPVFPGVAPEQASRLIEFVGKWAPGVGLCAGLGTLLAHVAGISWLACTLAMIGWVFVSLWLWRMRSQKRTTKAGGAPSRGTGARQFTATVALAFITVPVWGWVGWQIWSGARPTPPPDLTPFPEGKSGIIVAEFTQGAQERASHPDGVDLRDKLYNDLLRLVAQQQLKDRVLIQQAGPVKNEQEAVELGEQYKADLVIWGYVPTNQPHSFRPAFTLLGEYEELQSIDPILFGVEITGRDIAETSSLLTERARAVSSFVLGVFYLAAGEPGDYERAAEILTLAIGEAEAELQQNDGVQHDLLYNLALFHLTRGRAYAAMSKSEQALADYERALEYWPNFERAYTAIGNEYYARRDFETARTYFEKAESNWRGIFGLGLVAYHQQKYDLAVHYLDRALSAATDGGIVPGGESEMKLRFALGMAYKQSGDWLSAQSLLSQVCFAEDISPDFQAGVCVELTPPLPTSTPVLTETFTPTLTPMPVAAFTPVPGIVPAPSPRATRQPAYYPSPFPTPTETLLPAPPASTFPPTATVLPTYIPTPTYVPTSTLCFSLTLTPTPTATLLPTNVPTPTSTPTLLPTYIPTPPPYSNPTLTPTPTPTLLPVTPTPEDTPVSP